MNCFQIQAQNTKNRKLYGVKTYFDYSLKEAIKKYRQDLDLKGKHNLIFRVTQ